MYYKLKIKSKGDSKRYLDTSENADLKHCVIALASPVIDHASPVIALASPVIAGLDPAISFL